MSTDYITGPHTQDEFMAAATQAGWSVHSTTEHGTTVMTDGENFAHVHLPPFTAADGTTRVYFQSFGANDVDGLATATDAICEHDEAYDDLLDDAACAALGLVRITFG